MLAIDTVVGVSDLSDALFPFESVCFPYPFECDLYLDFPLSPFDDLPFDHPLLLFELLELDLSLALLSLYACIIFPV